ALRASTGAEPLHALRVAVRRLRSIVRAFRDLWPSPAGELALERLGECGRRLGAVRDFDVLLKALAADAERLPGALQPAARRALGWITSQRDAANAELHAWLRSAERLRATRELTEQLAAPDRTAEAANQPTAAAIPPRIAAAAAQLRKQCRRLPEDLPLPPLHALRIAVKRVRYLAEEFGSLPDLDLARPLADLTALQQVLGDVCDHDRGQERLLGWIQPAVAAASDDLATAGALGALAMLQTRASAKGRRKVVRALRAIDRKKVWRRLAAPEQPDANMTA
ncbi:MAG: CHAD domain-containing protein, partial [Planctomycetota bacterium]